MTTPTGNQDADHLVTLHQRIRDAVCTGTLDRAAVEAALDEADELVRAKFGAKKADAKAEAKDTKASAPSYPSAKAHA